MENAIASGKDVKKWLGEQEKGLSKKSTKFRQIWSLKSFWQKRKLEISVTHELTRLHGVVSRLIKILKHGSAKAEKKDLRQIVVYFKKIHKKYEIRMRELTSAVSNFQISSK